MTMPLEETIMSEIGLGANYQWFNGSGSCRYLRQKAAEKLADAIQKHLDAGEEIAPPDTELVALVKRVAQVGDQSEYELTKTWQAASYVIAEHIHQARGSEENRREAYERLKQYIEQNYISAHANRR